MCSCSDVLTGLMLLSLNGLSLLVHFLLDALSSIIGITFKILYLSVPLHFNLLSLSMTLPSCPFLSLKPLACLGHLLLM